MIVDNGTGYGTIVVDPPWTYTFSTRKSELPGTGWHGSAQKHYGTMSMAHLTALNVKEIAAPDCVLWLWAVNSQLDKALMLIDAWGFDFKTVLTWAKVSKKGNPYIGMGYWLRGSSEHALCAVRGKPKPLVRNIPTWFSAPVERHSAKPDYSFDIFEAHSPGPRIELFARKRRPGWDAWGDELTEIAT